MEIKERVYTLKELTNGSRKALYLLRDNIPCECPHIGYNDEGLSKESCGEFCPAFQIRKSTASDTYRVELKCFPQEVTYPITET
jgi:hypothetical protein